MAQQPLPDSFEYADAARHLAAGEGYTTTVHDDRAQPPRYPPLLPGARSVRRIWRKLPVPAC